MKKIGLICLAMVVALGTLGAAYAMWKDEVFVTTTVETGTVSVELFNQWSNDPMPRGISGDRNSYFAPPGSLDPKEPGTWNTTTKAWTLNRWPKNVASTECLITSSDAADPKKANDTITVTITEGYPSYWGSVLVAVKNTGSIPVKAIGYKLLQVSQGGVVKAPTDLNFVPYDPLGGLGKWNGRLLLNVPYFLDQDVPYPWGPSTGGGPELGQIESLLDPINPSYPNGFRDFDEALTFIISTESPGLGQIEPGGVGYFDVTIHVEQEALQTKLYDLKFKIEFCNWNE